MQKREMNETERRKRDLSKNKNMVMPHFMIIQRAWNGEKKHKKIQANKDNHDSDVKHSI